ncbi:uncharacterized protein LOC107019564 [Solanum pennellii]|uniref:Uncharacterized protein LOC107019564 n=1 Tax=Solanum pennellii TaxID=28526 RepID=A0ABM1GSX2_SOLPN|nr:uncharacterized protein LOC107019564 [Solanum pennellii]
MMRRFDTSDDHAKKMRGDLANISQKLNAHAVSIKHLEQQMAQLSTTVNPRKPGTLPRNTIQNGIAWRSLLEGCVPKKGGMTLVPYDRNEFVPMRPVTARGDTIEVFMDDFSVVGDTFDRCLSHLAEALKRCDDCNVVIHWETCLSRIFQILNILIFKLFDKECKLYFNESCLKVVGELKEKLVSVPITISPNWSKPFEVMCDTSGVALCVVLGQTSDKIFHPIYYASKALNEAQKNYTVTEQDLLAVVKGTENQVTDHLSMYEDEAMHEVVEKAKIDYAFPNEHLLVASQDLIPWYADLANYLASDIVPSDLSLHLRKKFMFDVNNFFWDAPYLYWSCADRIIHRCEPEVEM